MNSTLCTNFQPSLLRGLHTNYSILTSWEEMYRIITQDNWVKEQTQLYRATQDEKYKHALPAVTTAVQLDGRGKAVENIVGFTGVTHCDFDHIPPERLAEVMAKIKADPHTLLCNVSPSSSGIHIYVRYSLSPKINQNITENIIDSDKIRLDFGEGNYYEAFMTANCYYADLLGLPFDEQCSNPNKTLSLSYDLDAYYNPDATPFILSPKINQNITENIDSDKIRLNFGDKPHMHWVKEYTDPIEFAEKYVREKQGLTYSEGYRNAYLYNCLNMMNLLGVPRSSAESWLRSFDLPEREKQSILKSGYKRTADFGKFERPYTWREEVGTKTKNLGSCTCPNTPYTRTREEALPNLPEYQWPERLQRMIDCGETPAQRDVILLSAIVVIGALMSKTLRIPYGHKSFWPNLQLLPSQEAERKELSPMQRLLEDLPMHFSRKFALEKAQALDIKEGTLDSQLSRLVASGRLNKSDTGEYSFSAASRVRV